MAVQNFKLSLRVVLGVQLKMDLLTELGIVLSLSRLVATSALISVRLLVLFLLASRFMGGRFNLTSGLTSLVGFFRMLDFVGCHL